MWRVYSFPPMSLGHFIVSVLMLDLRAAVKTKSGKVVGGEGP